MFRKGNYIPGNSRATRPDNKDICRVNCHQIKARHAVHKKAFEEPDYCQTRLSQHILELKGQNFDPKVTWKILDKAKSYSPITDVCNLCNKEAYYIIFEPHLAELNCRSELFSSCMHKKPNLLFKPPRGRPKKSPGT